MSQASCRTALPCEWEVRDSNPRRTMPDDLQSPPFGRSGNLPGPSGVSARHRIWVPGEITGRLGISRGFVLHAPGLASRGPIRVHSRSLWNSQFSGASPVVCVAGLTGLEPAAFGFGDRCSIHLSYIPSAGRFPAGGGILVPFSGKKKAASVWTYPKRLSLRCSERN